MVTRENFEEILKNINVWEYIQDNIEYPKLPKINVRLKAVSDLENLIANANVDIETLKENIETYKRVIETLRAE